MPHLMKMTQCLRGANEISDGDRINVALQKRIVHDNERKLCLCEHLQILTLHLHAEDDQAAWILRQELMPDFLSLHPTVEVDEAQAVPARCNLLRYIFDQVGEERGLIHDTPLFLENNEDNLSLYSSSFLQKLFAAQFLDRLDDFTPFSASHPRLIVYDERNRRC